MRYLKGQQQMLLERIDLLNEFQKFMFEFVLDMINVYMLPEYNIKKARCTCNIEETKAAVVGISSTMTGEPKGLIKYIADYKIYDSSIYDGAIRYSASSTDNIFIMFESINENDTLIEFIEKARINSSSTSFNTFNSKTGYLIPIDKIEDYKLNITEDKFKKFMITKRFDL